MYKITVRFKSGEEEDFLTSTGTVFTEGVGEHRLVSFCGDGFKRVYNLDSVESFEIGEVKADEKKTEVPAQ